LKWQVRLPFAGAALSEIEAAPDRLLGQKAFTIKTGRTSSVGCKGAFVLKRYNSPGAANLFKNIFRSSRSRRAYRKGYHLELLGIPTPRSVATADRRIGPALRCSYLITESIPGAQELGAYLRCVDHPDKQVIYLTAQLLAQLHQEGFSHGDLKERNILLDSQLKPYIIDLDALRYRKGIHDAAAAGDLQRLNRALESYPNIGRWERFAFLRHYCRRRNLMRVPVPY
jgi:tRNA A-37 threonylcarbamoyl transferase component Bud32